jgi:N-acyl-D-amino-acid deacylase
MYDLIIRAARVIDGTGGAALTGDLAIAGERIVALGARLEGEARGEIDARGWTLAPGFIDAHTHDDLMVLRRAVVPPKVQQGLTTLVIGNCGFGLAPMHPSHMAAMQTASAAVLGEDEQSWNWPTLGALLETLRPMALGQHVRALLGHNALRVAVMGFETRPANEQELLTQEALIAEAMQAGAAGMSLGLMYVPGMYTPQDELIRLARVVGRYGGVITSHMRDEGDYLLNSVDEMLTLAEQAEVAVHISHLKVTGSQNWGSIHRVMERIADARARGLSITVDMYPYTAGSTTMTQLLPPWALAGGIEAMLQRLREPAAQRQVLQDFARGLPGWQNQVGALGWERIVLASVQQDAHRHLEGLSIAAAAEQPGLTPEEMFFHLLLEEKGRVTIIVFSMDERDVDTVVQSPFAMLGSDGLPILSGRPHPRLYGSFPRFLRRYVRELRSLTLEEAIHKITAFPAARFGIAERGIIAVGNIADLVLFDPERISDRATYTEPQLYPEGILAVLVAGTPVVMQGKLQEERPGHLLAPVGQVVQ